MIRPDVSRDGKWIVCQANHGGGERDVYLLAADGSQQRALTSDRHSGFPYWTGKGDRIAYRADGSSPQIWVMRPDGSGREAITEAFPAPIALSIWSPDGRQFWLRTGFRSKFFYRHGAPPVAFQDASPEGEEFDAGNWSPDGRKLIGLTHPKGQGTSGPVTVYSFASGFLQRFAVQAVATNWLSDSRRAVVQIQGRIFVLDTVSGKLQELVNLAPGEIIGLTVSADDRFLYFGLSHPTGQVWVADVNGNR